MQHVFKSVRIFETITKEGLKKYMRYIITRNINIRKTDIVGQPYLFFFITDTNEMNSTVSEQSRKILYPKNF